jgi:hypothetical protein
VSPSQLKAVLEYVQAQRERHRTGSFQEEYREPLRQHGIDFDERYSRFQRCWFLIPLMLGDAPGSW